MKCNAQAILSFALMTLTTMDFYLSLKLTQGNNDPVHIANSTLAGGVAIGSIGCLNISGSNCRAELPVSKDIAHPILKADLESWKLLVPET